MCVKLPPGDLNPDPCPPHSTSTYTFGVTIVPRVCGGDDKEILKKLGYNTTRRCILISYLIHIFL